jgi:hypothetical protein
MANRLIKPDGSTVELDDHVSSQKTAAFLFLSIADASSKAC